MNFRIPATGFYSGFLLNIPNVYRDQCSIGQHTRTPTRHTHTHTRTHPHHCHHHHLYHLSPPPPTHTPLHTCTPLCKYMQKKRAYENRCKKRATFWFEQIFGRISALDEVACKAVTQITCVASCLMRHFASALHERHMK